jgi:frataxin-like iron-binding protein CyaY
MAIGGKLQEYQQIEKLYHQLYEQLDKKKYGGQQEQIAGNVKVYTGPKKGKFIINKHGKKVYIDRKTLNTDLLYVKKKKGK